MSAAEILILAATVLSLEGGQAHLDRGLVEGLVPGDRGQGYYELEVAGRVSRIEVGEVEVLEVSPRESLVAAIGDGDLKAGAKVELQIPARRIRPRALLQAARRYLSDVERIEVSRALLAMVLEDEIFEAVLVEELEARRAGSSRSASAGSGPRPHDEVLVSAGTYPVGLDHSDAEYHNQQPRHSVELRAFRIDRSPVSLNEIASFVAGRNGVEAGPRMLQVGWQTAADFCRSRGSRLPSEAEWETAMRLPTMQPGELMEWTSSWYLPYPGRQTEDPAHGRKFRVLRGSFPGEQFDPYRRRYASSDARDPRYGFRCASSVAE